MQDALKGGAISAFRKGRVEDNAGAVSRQAPSVIPVVVVVAPKFPTLPSARERGEVRQGLLSAPGSSFRGLEKLSKY